MKKEIYVGIDFGTTNTMLSYVNEQSRRVEAIRMKDRSDYAPSCIALSKKEDRIVFGVEADEYNGNRDWEFRDDFKKELCDHKYSVSIPYGEKFTPHDLARTYFKLLREYCESQDFLIKKAVITCPVNAKDAWQEKLKSAVGIDDVVVVSESTAAGYAFFKENPHTRDNILVVDWGGGTLDLSFISKQHILALRHPQKRLESGLPIGGEDFNILLYRHIEDALSAQGYGDLLQQDLASPAWHNKALKKTRAIKEQLSSRAVDSFTQSSAVDPSFTYSLEIARDTFEQLISDILEEAEKLVLHIIQDNQLKPDFILLVGGSCRIPAVKKMLAKATGLECVHWDKALDAISYGAAYIAADKWLPAPQSPAPDLQAPAPKPEPLPAAAPAPTPAPAPEPAPAPQAEPHPQPAAAPQRPSLSLPPFPAVPAQRLSPPVSRAGMLLRQLLLILVLVAACFVISSLFA